MALPKANRLRSRQDFKAVYRHGLRRRSAHLTLLVLRQLPTDGKKPLQEIRHRGDRAQSIAVFQPLVSPPAPTRVGISISQKVSKRAVVRNRLKRWLKVAARSLLPKFSTGWDVIILVQPEATQCDYQQFLQELKQLLIDVEVCDGD